MSRRSLWQVAVRTSLEAEDAVWAWLQRAFGQPASSWTDWETRLATVSVCLAKRPDWFRSRRVELAAQLRRLEACGLDFRPGRLRLTRVPRQNWAESWKRHFQALSLGPALLLKPSWSRRRPRKGQAVVVLDPGLSFGTGRHPTTAFCLEQLIVRRRPGTAQSLLDVGCGSGILALAAAKLGYAPIAALDWDPEAIRVALANARRNRVCGRIEFERQALARLPRRAQRRFSLVCANLVANVLLAEPERLAAQVQPGGVLVLAGILKTEFAQVRRAYEDLGFKLAATGADQEWRSGAFAAQEALIANRKR